MVEQIKEILSDSTILELVANGTAELKIKLYTEKKLLLKFCDYYGVQTKPDWTKDEVVEGLVSTNDSEFLKSTLEDLSEDGDSTDVEGIKSYQFVDGFNDILCEIIARKVDITNLD
jgi:hypothetical protein